MTDEMEVFVEELRSGDGGRYRIRTISGSTYELNLDEGVMTRHRWSGEELSVPSDALRRDDERVALLSVKRCRVGERLVLLLAGVSRDPRAMFTVRQTTVVVSIVKITHR